MINLKGTMGLKSSKHKAGGLSSSEIIILFVAFIAIGLSTLTLVMNVYGKSSAKSFLSNTLINVPIKEIEYENDEYLTKYTSALKAIDSKLDYHTIGSVLMESDGDVNKEKITIVYYDGGKTIRSKEEGWSMDDDHDGICYYSDDMNEDYAASLANIYKDLPLVDDAEVDLTWTTYEDEREECDNIRYGGNTRIIVTIK